MVSSNQNGGKQRENKTTRGIAYQPVTSPNGRQSKTGHRSCLAVDVGDRSSVSQLKKKRKCGMSDCVCVLGKVWSRQFVLRAPVIAWLNQAFHRGVSPPNFEGGNHRRSNVDGKGNSARTRVNVSRQDVLVIAFDA